MNAFGIGKSGGASSPDSESLAETAGFPFEEMALVSSSFRRATKTEPHTVSLQHGRFPGLQQKGGKKLAQ